MKYCFSLVLCLFLSAIYSQSNALSKPKSKSNMELGLDCGLHYSKIFKAQVATYDPSLCGGNSACSTNISFKDKSTFGYQTGLSFKYLHVKTRIFAGLGLYYYRRTSLSEGSRDSVIKYNPIGSNPAYKITQSANNFEAPLFLGYSLNKFKFSAGINVVILSGVVEKEWNIDDTQYSHSINYSYRISNSIKPFIKVEYSLLRNKSNSSFGLNFSIEKLYSDNYAFLLGLNIPIISNQKKT